MKNYISAKKQLYKVEYTKKFEADAFLNQIIISDEKWLKESEFRLTWLSSMYDTISRESYLLCYSRTWSTDRF